jgi:hypothetical protein
MKFGSLCLRYSLRTKYSIWGTSYSVHRTSCLQSKGRNPAYQHFQEKKEKGRKRHISLPLTLENLAYNCDHPKKSTAVSAPPAATNPPSAIASCPGDKRSPVCLGRLIQFANLCLSGSEILGLLTGMSRSYPFASASIV